jgi:TPR repeat protein
MTAKGEGGAADPVAAWGWFRVADLAGHPRAAAAVHAMEARFTPKDRARADDYLARRAG